MGATQTQVAVAGEQSESRYVRIQARNTWLALDLVELWACRELLYLFVWCDIKVRYKQVFEGAVQAILQPMLTMHFFSLLFGKLAIYLPKDCRTLFFVTVRFCRGFISQLRLKALLTSLSATRGLLLKFIFRTSYCLLPRYFLAFRFLDFNFREVGKVANGISLKYA